MANATSMSAMPFLRSEEDDDCFRISFCDDFDHPENYMIIERAKVFTEQGVLSGMNTYYIEIGGPQNSQYGGIDQIIFIEDRLTLYFTPGSPLFGLCSSLHFQTDRSDMNDSIVFVEDNLGITIFRK